jgi:hypothetical protein
MPPVWQTHCSGCRAPAVDARSSEGSTNVSTSGCRCVVCPDWFACDNCAGTEAAAHRDAHPNERHFTYRVATDGDAFVPFGEALTAPISAWKVSFKLMLWPFLKMFVPTSSVIVQVVAAHTSAFCRFSRVFLQMSIYNFYYACSGNRSVAVYALSVIAALSCFFVLQSVLMSATSGASEIVIFEKMLSESVYIDCHVPNFNSISEFQWLSFIALMYFVCSTAVIVISLSATASMPPSIGITAQSRPLFHITSVVFSNALALAGGFYFIYEFRCDGAKFGRHSTVSLRHRSLHTAKKLAEMKGVAVGQIALACKACVLAVDIASLQRTRFSPVQVAALKERLCCGRHLYSIAMLITQDHVDGIAACKDTLLASDSFATKVLRYTSAILMLLSGFQHRSDMHFR